MGNIDLSALSFANLERAAEEIRNILAKANSSQLYSLEEKAKLASLPKDNAMELKGVLYTGDDIMALVASNEWHAGWTWIVGGGFSSDDTAGFSPNGSYYYEIGDVLFAIKDHPEETILPQNANDYFVVTQKDIDGAVTNTETASEDGIIPVFSGASGKKIKKTNVNIVAVENAISKTGLSIKIRGNLLASTAVESDDEAFNNISFDMLTVEVGDAFVVKEAQNSWWGNESSLPQVGDLVVSLGNNASVEDNWLVLSGKDAVAATQKALETTEYKANKGQADGYAPLNNETIVPDEHLPLKRERTLLSNALKGTASGAVVALNDVSPVEHEVECVVRSNNAIIYPFISSDGTYAGDENIENSGVKITTENGKITLNGTANTNFTFRLCNNMSLLPNTQYTLHGLTGVETGNHIQMFVAELVDGKYGTYYASIWSDVSKTFTTSKDVSKEYIISLYVKSDSTFENLTIHPMLELGTEATEFIPYVSPETIKIKQYEKNILVYPYWESSKTYNGITFTDNGDGSITINGTATADASFRILSQTVPLILPAGTTITLKKLTETDMGVRIDFQEQQANGEWEWAGYARENDKTYTTTGILYFYVLVPNGTTVDNITVYPQVEVGGVATDWENPTTPVEYTPAADGTVSGVNSISPNMTLIPDTDGVVIDCTYNRDINKAFEEMYNAIISLGGNI